MTNYRIEHGAYGRTVAVVGFTTLDGRATTARLCAAVDPETGALDVADGAIEIVGENGYADEAIAARAFRAAFARYGMPLAWATARDADETMDAYLAECERVAEDFGRSFPADRFNGAVA